jgi:hypothetical protein
VHRADARTSDAAAGASNADRPSCVAVRRTSGRVSATVVSTSLTARHSPRVLRKNLCRAGVL